MKFVLALKQLSPPYLTSRSAPVCESLSVCLPVSVFGFRQYNATDIDFDLFCRKSSQTTYPISLKASWKLKSDKLHKQHWNTMKSVNTWTNIIHSVCVLSVYTNWTVYVCQCSHSATVLSDFQIENYIYYLGGKISMYANMSVIWHFLIGTIPMRVWMCLCSNSSSTTTTRVCYVEGNKFSNGCLFLGAKHAKPTMYTTHLTAILIEGEWERETYMQTSTF